MTFRQKVPLYIRIMYGLLVLFIIVGFIIGKTTSSVIMTSITATLWVINRIIAEAISAWQENQQMKKMNKPDDIENV